MHQFDEAWTLICGVLREKKYFFSFNSLEMEVDKFEVMSWSRREWND